MSYHIFALGEHTAIAVATPIVKADEREDFIRAVDMLAAVNALAARTSADVQTQSAAGYKEGYSRGLADAEAQIAASVADIVARFETICTARSNDIAEAALAATRAIIGTFDDDQVVRGLVTQAISRIDTSAPLTVEVAPAVAARLTRHLAHLDTVMIEANPKLDPLDCVLKTPASRILAGLDLQLSALENRWGIAPQTAEIEPAL